MENTQSLDTVCYYVFFKFFVKERAKATKRHLIINAAELKQPI